MSEDEAQNLQDRIENLHDDVRAKHREDRSIWMWLWRGVLFGIGSTVGVALIFYVFLLVAERLSGVPYLGNVLKQLEPLVKQSAETRVPNVEKYLPAITANEDAATQPADKLQTTETSQSQSVVTKTVTDATGLYTLEVPSDWTVSTQKADASSPELLSYTVIQSPQWKSESKRDAPVNGMYISLNAIRDAYPDLGDTTSAVDGESAASEHTEGAGLDTDTIRWNHGSHGYLMTATYNPETYDGPGKLIEDILISFKFTK